MAIPATLYLIATAISAGASVYSTQEAGRRADKAEALQERIASLKAQRERRRQIASAKRARARILAQSEASGTQQSSGVVGGVGSIQTQAASNIGFLNQTQTLGAQATSYQKQSRKYSQYSQLFDTASRLSYGQFQEAGGFDKLFSKPTGE